MESLTSFLGPELLAQISNVVVWVLTSTVLLLMGLSVYVWITPYNDLQLIREGNLGVAISLAGTLLGLLIPVLAIVATSHTIAELIVWATIALAIQLLLLFLERFAVKGMRHAMVAEKKTSCGVWLGTLAFSTGLIIAVCSVT